MQTSLLDPLEDPKLNLHGLHCEAGRVLHPNVYNKNIQTSETKNTVLEDLRKPCHVQQLCCFNSISALLGVGIFATAYHQ